MRNFGMVAVLCLAISMLLCLNCTREKLATVQNVPFEKIKNANVTNSGDRAVLKEISILTASRVDGSDGNYKSDTNITELEKDSSGLKVLPVTKITSSGNNAISKEELKVLLINGKKCMIHLDLETLAMMQKERLHKNG